MWAWTLRELIDVAQVRQEQAREEWRRAAFIACAVRNVWLQRSDQQTPEELLGWPDESKFTTLVDPAASFDELIARQQARHAHA